MKYYVDAATNKNGNPESPFRTIQEAADVAAAGDIIEVAPGIYREYVNPKEGGKEGRPVVYHSSKPLAAIITGAELLTGWEEVPGRKMSGRHVLRTAFSEIITHIQCRYSVTGIWLRILRIQGNYT